MLLLSNLPFKMLLFFSFILLGTHSGDSIADTKNQQNNTVSVIANPSVNLKGLTHRQLRTIFLMQQTNWQNGKKITVFVLPDKNELHRKFSKEKLKMFPYQIVRLWNKLAYSGLGDIPTELDSERSMLEKIISTPDSIGYVGASTSTSGVKVIAVSEVEQ